jgi:hypothetical protein
MAAEVRKHTGSGRLARCEGCRRDRWWWQLHETDQWECVGCQRQIPDKPARAPNLPRPRP